MKTHEALILLCIGLAMGFMGGMQFSVQICHKAAIAAGVAEYQVDPKTGQTNFVYLKPTK